MTPLSQNSYGSLTTAMANMTASYTLGNYSTSLFSPAIYNTTVPAKVTSIDDPNITATSPVGKGADSDYKSDSKHPKSPEPQTQDVVRKEASLNAVKKEVSSSFFYKNNKMKILCAPSIKVIDIKPQDNDVNFPFERWPRWRKEYVDISRARADIENMQHYCRGTCDCDEKGAIVPRDLGHDHSCSKKWLADRCSLVYGDPAPIEEYQAALNRIPQTVRNDNPNFFWRMGGLGLRPWNTMTWTPSEMDVALRSMAVGPPRAIERLPERPPELLRSTRAPRPELQLLRGEPPPQELFIDRPFRVRPSNPEELSIDPPLYTADENEDPTRVSIGGGRSRYRYRYEGPGPSWRFWNRFKDSYLDKREVIESHGEDIAASAGDELVPSSSQNDELVSKKMI
ncbi:hypothetical protein TWF718_002213 [Orbilia javanica]|uniref:Uncharacterized protein n=1 Tax=Orbilia javanica TaxID=47235 RepID=A0AAN8R9P7_9PEZI